MVGTLAVFMPVASMARRWSIIIMAAAAGTAAAPPLPVQPLARRPSALRWALSLPLFRPDALTIAARRQAARGKWPSGFAFGRARA